MNKSKVWQGITIKQGKQLFIIYHENLLFTILQGLKCSVSKHQLDLEDGGPGFFMFSFQVSVSFSEVVKLKINPSKEFCGMGVKEDVDGNTIMWL